MKGLQPFSPKKTTFFLPGYTIHAPLFLGSRNWYYRAERNRDALPVIVKAAAGMEGGSDPQRFHHEREVLQALAGKGAPACLGIEKHHDSYALILESLPGDCVAGRNLGGDILLRDILTIGMKAADILSYLHEKNAIHREVNPEILFYCRDSGELWFGDFSSTTFPEQLGPIGLQQCIAGESLPYMSPEQTGRMNRPTDFRTDFYSLGVTLYQLLTGKAPFSGSDELEIVYSHLARQPVSPAELNPLVPEMVAAVIMKLLAKPPEDRYQSGWGLKSDFEECLRRLDSRGEIPYFPLGQDDVSERLNISRKLYGREQERELLLKYFDGIGDDAARMVMVSGYSGIGKTSLVQEIYKPLIARTGYYLRGKFDQLHSTIPYSGLVQAFGDLAGQLLSESELQLRKWQEELLSALGSNIRAIIDVIPELELITGPQPSLAELGADETQNRFNRVFLDFMRVFCQPAHPLVIFLDDLQWVDSATSKLVELIMGTGELHHLLVIGAYRKNEVHASHPLLVSMDSIVKNGGILRYIDVSPLSPDAVTSMIGDMLHRNAEDVKELAMLVAAKTGGNPFFVTHFLTMLHQEALLVFDRKARSWAWDFERIKKLDFTDNVVDLLVHRLHYLSRETRSMLQMAACIGSRFSIQMLSMITGSPEPSIRRHLAPALRQDLLVAVEGMRVGASDKSGGREVEVYRFQHDRVLQASYTLIPEKQRKIFHLLIGRALLANFDESRRDEEIFDILLHLNFASELITVAEEKLTLVNLNLVAGKKAKASVAFEPALDYFTNGLSHLPGNCWDGCYNLTLRLHLEYLEALRLTGHLNKLDPLFATIKKEAHVPFDTVEAYECRIKGFMAEDRLKDALLCAREILGLLGVTMPERALKSESRRVLKKTMAILAERGIENLLDLPAMTDAHQLAVMRILVSIISVIYIGSPDLFSHLLCKQVLEALQYGNAPGLVFLFAAFGVLLCGLGNDIEAGYQFGELSLALAAKRNSLEHKGQAMHAVSCYVNHWKLPLRDTLDLARDGYRSALEAGDFEFASYNIYCYCKHSFLSGRPLDIVEKEMEEYQHIVRKLKQEISLRFLKTFHQCVLHLLGRSTNPRGFAQGEETLLQLYQQANNRLGIFYLYFCKLMLCYLLGDYQNALHYTELAEKEEVGEYGGPLAVPLIVFYGALARMAVYHDALPAAREQILKKAAASLKKMRLWARQCPANYQNKLHLLQAEFCSMTDNHEQAVDNYHQAMATAHLHQLVQDEALACELTAGYWQRKGKAAFAETFWRQARSCYSAWGCYAKVAQLDKKLEPFREKLPLPPASGSYKEERGKTSSGGFFARELDLVTVMKASQVIHGEIDLEKLLAALMHFTIENSGAERGSLIMCEGGDLKIGAQYEAGACSVFLFQDFPIEKARNISTAIIHFVARTREFLVIDDVVANDAFKDDPYIAGSKPQALFCCPIIHKQRLLSILYLESRLISGLFSSMNREVIRMLTIQMAVSIDNASLYERLKKTEGKYRRIFENALEGIYQTTIAGQIVNANPAMARILGYDSPEDLILRITDIGSQLYVSRKEREHFLRIIGKEKTVSGFEVQFYRRDRSIIWVSLHARLLEDHHGSDFNIEGIFSDVTERKAAVEELREREEWLRKENVRLRANIKDRYRFGKLVGKSQAMRQVYEFILKAAGTDANVMINGESGTGKELVARAIHDLSDRKHKNIVTVNCGAIPENLLESEFFGYRKGAFTGASRDKKGYLDLADGGTIFLDEIGELSLNMQVKLLRVLDGRGYIPIGGDEVRFSDARFIAATNRNLQDQVKQGLMREDFFYRIHILPADLPPLRNRKEDLPLLVEHFMEEFGKKSPLPPLTGEIMDAITRHDWPGNVRELQNVLRRYVSLGDFTLASAREAPRRGNSPAAVTLPEIELDDHRLSVEQHERNLIETSLVNNKWHKANAAASIGMAKRTFFRKIKKYGLDKKKS